MHAAPFVKAGFLASLLGCCALAQSVWAGQARLVEESGPEQVVIETTDASADVPANSPRSRASTIARATRRDFPSSPNS